MAFPIEDDVSEFVEQTRQKKAAVRRPKSKLDIHREAIMAAVAEKLPVRLIREVLDERYGLKVSYSNLRVWIHRQRHVSKADGKKTSHAEADQPASHDPNEPPQGTEEEAV